VNKMRPEEKYFARTIGDHIIITRYPSGDPARWSADITRESVLLTYGNTSTLRKIESSQDWYLSKYDLLRILVKSSNPQDRVRRRYAITKEEIRHRLAILTGDAAHSFPEWFHVTDADLFAEVFQYVQKRLTRRHPDVLDIHYWDYGHDVIHLRDGSSIDVFDTCRYRRVVFYHRFSRTDRPGRRGRVHFLSISSYAIASADPRYPLIATTIKVPESGKDNAHALANPANHS
jgi:hypothetical protein